MKECVDRIAGRCYSTSRKHINEDACSKGAEPEEGLRLFSVPSDFNVK
jgi:hypothetical protein